MNRDATAAVLVVDDEPTVLETITAILAQEGYRVTAVRSAEDALPYLQSGQLDLVLTDLRMAGASGLSLLEEVHGQWPDTVVIILTGYASLESAIDALRVGAYDYLTKPCDVQELKSTVARGIERGQLARALRQRMEELDAANERLRRFADELQRRVDEATAELRQKVDELAEAKRSLEEAHRQREEFVSMIAHELGQPLTTISGYAQLLGRRNIVPEVEERARSTISAETRRLGRLVQDLADAWRVSAGRFPVDLAESDLASIVREQVDLARGGTDRHTIELDAHVEQLPVLCDEDRIAQVLSNLLDNAIKYSDGPKIHVAIRVDGRQAIITVRDRGPGIPRDRLEAIFQPHVRLGGPTNNGPR
ncbi:MAG: response regulator, partial [Chloroflexi bacterium]|nr:response regulator [Chloroflexota bacterium]